MTSLTLTLVLLCAEISVPVMLIKVNHPQNLNGTSQRNILRTPTKGDRIFFFEKKKERIFINKNFSKVLYNQPAREINASLTFSCISNHNIHPHLQSCCAQSFLCPFLPRCKSGFSAVSAMKTKYRSRQQPSQDMWVTLSKIIPRLGCVVFKEAGTPFSLINFP